MINTEAVSYLVTLAIASVVLFPVKCEEKPTEIFSQSACNFAIELLKVASKDGENTVLSPVSISVLLAILRTGADGNTATELDHVLGAGENITKNGYKGISWSFTEKQRVTIEWANRIYTKEGLNINPGFMKEVEENFKTKLEELNLKRESSDVITDKINAWISNSTRGLIRNIVEPQMVGTGTVMLLVNAIYFRGNWKNRFRQKYTRMDNFNKNLNEVIATPFMYQRNKFYTGKNHTLGVKWIEMPLEGNEHKVIFVIPIKRFTLDNVMSQMTGQNLLSIIRYASVSDVRLRLPKFKVAGKYSLVPLLRMLGLNDLFTHGSNLAKLSPEPIQVSEAVHQASFEIDEKGTTASASTVLAISRKLILTETFRFDQPFLFFIVDSVNEVPYFAGKVVDPSVF